MLPPTFLSTPSRAEKQSGKGKQTLSISQIETIHKKDSHEFPDQSIYWLDFEILLCFVFFALSNLTINVNFLAERKRSYLIFT